MKIERVQTISPESLRKADFSFDVEEEAAPPFDGPALKNVAPVERYTKQYRVNLGIIDAPDASRSMIAVAREGCQVAGYIDASRAWNNCARIDDFAVDRAYRRQGLGRQLMDEAVCWAWDQGLRVVRLETQANNIPACRFYERYGFRLGGFDRHLYDEIPAHPRPETALFWYFSILRD